MSIHVDGREHCCTLVCKVSRLGRGAIDKSMSEGAWTGSREAGVDRREMEVRGMDTVRGSLPFFFLS